MQHVLTPSQEHVLALISAGSSITAAAQAADIHRNTVHHWITTSSEFRIALLQAREAKAAYWREQAEDLASTAIDTIRAILSDPSHPASVRLKAAQSILTLATTPVLSSATSVNPWIAAASVHNSAQPIEPSQPSPESPAFAAPTLDPQPPAHTSPSDASIHDSSPSETVHNSAQPVAQSQPSPETAATVSPRVGTLPDRPDHAPSHGIGASALFRKIGGLIFGTTPIHPRVRPA